MTKFLLFVGKSCVGKDTFIKKIKQKYNNYDNIYEMKNCTTRPKRNNNEDTYYFISKEEMLKNLINDKFIECYVYNNWSYGLLKSEIHSDKINITSLSIERANLFYDYLKENNMLDNCLVVFMSASEEIRIERYLNRLRYNNSLTIDNVSELVRRFKSEDKEYKINILEEYPHIVYLNTDNNEYDNKIMADIDNFLYRKENVN